MTTDLTRHRVVAHERVVATSTEALRETVVVCVESSRQELRYPESYCASLANLRAVEETPSRRWRGVPEI